MTRHKRVIEECYHIDEEVISLYSQLVKSKIFRTTVGCNIVPTLAGAMFPLLARWLLGLLILSQIVFDDDGDVFPALLPGAPVVVLVTAARSSAECDVVVYVDTSVVG